ncbi:unnamed protein product, partial [Tilletia caries]
ITSWALVLGALASSTAAGFVNRQPTAVFNLTSPLGRSFLSDSTALRARGDLPSGSGCNFDADCSTGWCSFDFEIGNNAYVNYASKTSCDRKLGLFDLKFDHDYVEAGDYKQSIYNIEFDYCHDVEAGEHKYEHECERIDDEVDNQFLIVDSHVWVEHDDQACYDLGQYCDIQICVDEQEQQQHHVKIQHIVDHLQVDHIGDDQQAHKHVHFFHHKQVDFDFDKNHSRLVQHEPSDDDDDQVEHDYLYPYAYQDTRPANRATAAPSSTPTARGRRKRIVT